MQKPATMRELEELGRVRLSKSFYMRNFLHSEISNFHAIPNIPDDPDLAIAAGRKLCEEILEPLRATFGDLAIRSSYRSAEVNAFGHENGLSCANNKINASRHIWDRRDAEGHMGAMACVVVPWFAAGAADRDAYQEADHDLDWRAMAWWVHDHLNYNVMHFMPDLGAFNVAWHENPIRRITSAVAPEGVLTEPGMDNQAGSHAAFYPGFPELRAG
jgi:hypothetical protein